MKTGFGIIGCGNISRFHFNGLEKAGADIVHISDISEDAARPYAERFKAKFSKDYIKLLEDPDVTVVSVLTTSNLHREICRNAIRMGKDIIVEKTMMNNSQEAYDMVKDVVYSDRIFFTAYMKRFIPAVNKAKELLPSLGRIISAQVCVYQNWGGNYYEDHIVDENAQRFIRNNGGAMLKCGGSHMIDSTMYLLGRPESVYAHMDFVPDSELDRKTTALFEYNNGMTVSFEAAIHSLDKIGYERNSWDERIHILGVNGSLDVYTVKWDEPEKNGSLLVHYDNGSRSSTEYRFDRVNPFDVEMQYFNNCLNKRHQGNPDVLDGYNTDVVIESILKSHQLKAAVNIDWRGL